MLAAIGRVILDVNVGALARRECYRLTAIGRVILDVMDGTGASR